MQKIQCPLCNERFTKADGLYNHLAEDHEEDIPKGFTPARFAYMLRTGKDHGSCVVCKKDTQWNENTGKYKRFCENKKCKDSYREQFKKRMIGKYGKTTLLNDPEQQRLMLSHRSISGEYKWSDGTIKSYTGSYELDFLKMLDAFMQYDSDDIITPSPHTYFYIYENEKKFYIPDAYIPSLNLEIEIKDGAANPNMHHKIQDVDKVKERLKDDVMKSQKNVNYIKIVDKNYDNFFKYLLDSKAKLMGSTDTKFSTMDLVEEKFDDVVIESNTHTPMYFYHLLNKDVVLDSKGLISPDYMYKHNMMDLYATSVDKYRNRLVDGWSVYPGKHPNELTLNEIYDGINKYRKTSDGNKQIYFFRYPPHAALGPSMKEILERKIIVRIDINDPKVQKYIKSIDYGYEMSSRDNKKLTRKYYEDVNEKEYFSKYDDSKPMKFATLNHISITPKNGYLPKGILEFTDAVGESSYDFVDVLEESEVVTEALTSLKEYKPVYIILTQGKTPVISDGIKLFTNSEWTHASIAFDPHFKNLFSFNFRSDTFGFIEETIASFKMNTIAVYCFFLKLSDFEKVKAKVEDFRSHSTMFDFRIFVNKILHINKKASNNEYNQVCSTFVDAVLKSAGINFFNDIELPSPGDFYDVFASDKYKNKIYLLYKDSVTKYDPKKIQAKVYRIIHKKDADIVIPDNEK